MADLKTEWQVLVEHYIGVVVVVAAGLVFAVVMLCAGIIFCCCRRCGHCGARKQPFDNRRDPCKRITLGIILAVICIIILFGVVCAFVTNEHMEEGTQKLPSTLNTSVSDIKLYLTNTEVEVDTLLVTNFQELKITVDMVLNKSGAIVQDQLAEVSKASILSNLTELVQRLETIKNDLQQIQIITKRLQVDCSNLDHNLTEVKRVLQAELQKCGSLCKEAEVYVSHLSLNPNFQQLPLFEESLSSVNHVLTVGRIKDKVMNGMNEFNKIQKEIQNAVKDLRPGISGNMSRAGVAMKERSQQITNILKSVEKSLSDDIPKAMHTGEEVIVEYAPYRYYTDLSASCILLLILLCATLGLFYGFCAKRPYGYDDDCWTRATGARLLILGVSLMFLFSAALMVIMLVHFVLGVVTERSVCEQLQNPRDTELLRVLDNFVKSKHFFKHEMEVNISAIIRSCHANGSMYEVLNLADVVNISEVSDYKRRYGIDNAINQLKTRIDFVGNVVILNEDAKRELQYLMHSRVSSINFPKIAEVLSEPIVTVNLEKMAQLLRETASKVPSNASHVGSSLNRQADILDSLQSTLVQKTEAQLHALASKINAMEQNMMMNHMPFNENIMLILQEVTIAQQFLDTAASKAIKRLAEMLANAILALVDGYWSRVVIVTTTKVGQCHPLSQVYNATVVAVCNKILDPINGFWASIAWCLLLFIPAIILSVILASLYRKSDPYPRSVLESEYLYDAYGDRDNIPLANVDKNYHRRYHETYDNASGYYGGDYSGHLGRYGDRGGFRDRASPAAHNDMRYTDMAPKHWHYPTGGPVRYHSPPLSTEYERPPPYYYPGPGNSSRR